MTWATLTCLQLFHFGTRSIKFTDEDKSWRYVHNHQLIRNKFLTTSFCHSVNLIYVTWDVQHPSTGNWGLVV
ncbi:hypothetical protein MJG53_002388 [Ovis ammon polii x Ovis aries]|uniref:Uncharacterized protein n=1 Tax=Ovis ammon polii x Ovis aries TaxID=2918886 RepID=A0ACB9VER5_9CETA|nr:hypothetical protein MJT46_003717 [Ovis ammon polii x Ovis aries]KAI4587980.1 hypothetical protein MJG53_002388 [Ovis ammon polii x Ovis aries]